MSYLLLSLMAVEPEGLFSDPEAIYIFLILELCRQLNSAPVGLEDVLACSSTLLQIDASFQSLHIEKVCPMAAITFLFAICYSYWVNEMWVFYGIVLMVAYIHQNLINYTCWLLSYSSFKMPNSNYQLFHSFLICLNSIEITSSIRAWKRLQATSSVSGKNWTSLEN